MLHKISLALWLWVIVVFAGFIALVAPPQLHAAAVGRFTKVEGQVDLLKAGRLPAAAAKVPDPVEQADVIRTKSQSRAQVQFVDDTILTLAPESRVAVADYFYDGAKGRRRALLQVFQGLAHTVVKRVLELQEPDFLMQTHTAAIGVRGTEWYTLLLPNSTIIYNIQGLLEASSSNRRILGSVLLHALKYCEVRRDEAPGLARDITPAILAMLRQMLQTGAKAAPPDISGAEGPLREFRPPELPEGVMPPYAPHLVPVEPHRTPGTIK